MKHIMLNVNYIPKQKQQQNLPSTESSLIPESAGPELAHVGPNVDKANPTDVSSTKHLWEPGARRPHLASPAQFRGQRPTGRPAGEISLVGSHKNKLG